MRRLIKLNKIAATQKPQFQDGHTFLQHTTDIHLTRGRSNLLPSFPNLPSRQVNTPGPGPNRNQTPQNVFPILRQHQKSPTWAGRDSMGNIFILPRQLEVGLCQNCKRLFGGGPHHSNVSFERKNALLNFSGPVIFCVFENSSIPS